MDYAEAEALQGDAAVFHILGWAEGNYRFVEQIDTSRRPNLRSTIQTILMHAKKRDQVRESNEGVPLKSLPKKYTPT